MILIFVYITFNEIALLLYKYQFFKYLNSNPLKNIILLYMIYSKYDNSQGSFYEFL